MLGRKMKELGRKLFGGELVMSKGLLWLVGFTCVCVGVIIGLFAAPATRGMTIGSNNGNHNCNNSDSNNISGLEEEEA